MTPATRAPYCQLESRSSHLFTSWLPRPCSTMWCCCPPRSSLFDPAGGPCSSPAAGGHWGPVEPRPPGAASHHLGSRWASAQRFTVTSMVSLRAGRVFGNSAHAAITLRDDKGIGLLIFTTGLRRLAMSQRAPPSRGSIALVVLYSTVKALAARATSIRAESGALCAGHSPGKTTHAGCRWYARPCLTTTGHGSEKCRRQRSS